MKRISDLERKYAIEALDNEFNSSRNSVFNNRMEQKFSDIVGCRYSIGHINGTATLHTALAALEIKPDEEVIVPPLTMSSTALSVLQNGSVPIFADVDPNTFNISPDAVRKVITEKTRAIMSVSLYGLTPDYDGLLDICREHGLALIEDNAQCLLGTYKGIIAGNFGHFASFSFQASKHMTSGEGGMLTTNDQDLADKARRFSSLGYAGVNATQGKISRNDIQDPRYSRHIAFGYNYRMSEVTAAVALGQLERLTELVELRIKVAKLFREIIKGVDFLKPQAESEGYVNSYWTVALVLKTDDPSTQWYRFRDLFQKNGGDGYYAAWKLSYQEPLFLDQIQIMPGVWQKYNTELCMNAEYLQPRMIQLKTNYWNFNEAERQAEVLSRTIREFNR